MIQSAIILIIEINVSLLNSKEGHNPISLKIFCKVQFLSTYISNQDLVDNRNPLMNSKKGKGK